MRMRGLEPPQSYLHTDLNRIEAVSLRPGASDASKLRGFVDVLDAVDGVDVVTVLSRPAAKALRLWYATGSSRDASAATRRASGACSPHSERAPSCG